jgi:hypothetical protein
MLSLVCPVDLLQTTIQLRLTSLSCSSSMYFPLACRLFLSLLAVYSLYSPSIPAIPRLPSLLLLDRNVSFTTLPLARPPAAGWLAGRLGAGGGCCGVYWCWSGVAAWGWLLLLVWSAAGLLCRESGSESVGFLVGRSASSCSVPADVSGVWGVARGRGGCGPNGTKQGKTRDRVWQSRQSWASLISQTSRQSWASLIRNKSTKLGKSKKQVDKVGQVDKSNKVTKLVQLCPSLNLYVITRISSAEGPNFTETLRIYISPLLIKLLLLLIVSNGTRDFLPSDGCYCSPHRNVEPVPIVHTCLNLRY